MSFDRHFREVARRKVGGGPKTMPADEIVWYGEVDGTPIILTSRVRLINPMESFLTSSGHRLRDSKVGDAGHWIDLQVEGSRSPGQLRRIARWAQAADERPVVARPAGKEANRSGYFRRLFGVKHMN